MIVLVSACHFCMRPLFPSYSASLSVRFSLCYLPLHAFFFLCANLLPYRVRSAIYSKLRLWQGLSWHTICEVDD
jgi:hypothetical protein